MADTQFRAILTLEDRASMPLRGLATTVAAVNAGIEASNAQVAARFNGLRTATGQLGGELTRLGNNTGLARLVTHTRALGGEIHALTRNSLGMVTTLFPTLAGLGAVGGAAGLVQIMHSATDAAGHMEDLMLMTGQTAEALGQMRFAAAMVGTDFDGAVIPAINKLTLSIAKAREGGEEETQAFRNMGISARVLAVESTAQIFERVSDSFARVQARVESGAISQATATQFYARQARTIMGRGGIEEIKMLREFREHQAELRRLSGLANRRDGSGNVVALVTAEERAQMDKLGDTFTAIGAMVGALRMAIGRELAPVLLPVAEHLRDWLAANRETIASGFRDFVRDTAANLRSIDWPALVQGAKDFGSGTVKLVDDLGGLKRIGEGLVVLIGVQLVGSLAGAAAQLAKVGAAVALVSGPVMLAATAVGGLAWAIIELKRANADAAAAGPRAMPLAPPRAGSLRSARPIEGFDSDVPGERATPWWERSFAPPSGRFGGDRPGPRRSPLLDLYQPSSTAAPAARDSTVTVRFENAPPGMRVTTDAAGPGAPTLDVGYAWR